MQKYKLPISCNHKRFLGSKILICLSVCFVFLTVPVVDARHLSLEDVETLEKQCMAAEEPIYTEFRERAIAECEEHEKNNRGDPETCAGRHAGIQPHPHLKRSGPSDLNFIINPPLPICVKADEARRHFRVYP